MADASDEQTWWSNLFADGTDPALEVPDDVWESVVATALEFDAPDPADDLIPPDQPETGFDGSHEPGVYHDPDPPSAHGDAVAHDGVAGSDPDLDADSFAEDAYQGSGGHEAVYHDVPNDPVDGSGAFDDHL